MNSKTIIRLLSALFLVVLIPHTSKASCTVSGTVTITTSGVSGSLSGTYTFSGGILHPTGDVIIPANTKLDIQTGVTVKMDAGKRIQVQKDGRLRAIGVFFTANTSSHWLGIEILGNPAIPAQPTAGDAYNMTVHSYSGTGYATDQKGAAYLSKSGTASCIIEKCNYGIVVGSIPFANAINVYETDGGGGGTIIASYLQIQYTDYIGIMLVPFKGNNASCVTYCNIYADYPNTDYMGLALFTVTMTSGNITGNTFKYRPAGTGSTFVIGGIYCFGIYCQNSGFYINNNSISYFNAGIRVADIHNVLTERIYSNTFTNNWWDIKGDGVNNLTIRQNTINKGLNWYNGIGSGNVAGIQISGDYYYIFENTLTYTSNVGNRDDMGIWYVGGSTPLYKTTLDNTFTNIANCAYNNDPNLGMQLECNTFIKGSNPSTTYIDVNVNSGGLPDQGDRQIGVSNSFHSSCTPSTQWYQNTGVAGIAYHFVTGMDLYPTCRSSSVSLSTAIHPCGCNAPNADKQYIANWWPPVSRSKVKFKIDSLIDSIGALPPSVSLMTANQYGVFHSASYLRDIYVGALIRDYIDSVQYDSAFYIMDLYPCQRSYLEKMNLKLTLEDYSGLSTITSEIANVYDDCATGYCDHTMSTQAAIYYPIVISLKVHHYSDSILNENDSALLSLANTNTYFGGMSKNILQCWYDSLFKVYHPHDSLYQDSSLYPDRKQQIVYGPGEPMQGAGITLSTNTEDATEIHIAPNPAFDNLRVSFSGNPPSMSIPYAIYSVLGQKIIAGVISVDQVETIINISNLPKGIYILEMSNFGKTYKSRFVRQ